MNSDALQRGYPERYSGIAISTRVFLQQIMWLFQNLFKELFIWIRLKGIGNFSSPLVTPVLWLIILTIKINLWIFFSYFECSWLLLLTAKSYHISLSIRLKGPQLSDIFSPSKYLWVVIKSPPNLLSDKLNGSPLIFQYTAYFSE